MVGGTVAIGKRCFDDAGTFDKEAACISATVALGLNPADPRENFFYASFNGLYLDRMVEVFTSVATYRTFSQTAPDFVKKTGFSQPESLGLKPDEDAGNPTISFCANPTGISLENGLDVPGGFHLSGSVNVLGWEAAAVVAISPGERFFVDFEMSPIGFAGDLLVVRRTPDDAERGPKFKIDLKYGPAVPSPPFFRLDVFIKGYAKILGTSCEVTIIIDDRTFLFKTTLKAWAGVVTVRLEVEMAYSTDPGAVGGRLRVYGFFSFDLREITDKLAAGLRNMAEEAHKAINGAIAEVREAKKECKAALQIECDACQFNCRGAGR